MEILQVFDNIERAWENRISNFDDLETHLINATSFITLDGLWFELGVAKGTSTKILSNLTKKINKTLYAADSFKGLPEFWREQITNKGIKKYDKGHFKTEMPTINNVEMLVGLFEDTLPKFVANNKNKKLAFLHVDCDLYSSTKLALNTLKPMITKGTVITFDEFREGEEIGTYPEWIEHEAKAWAEFVCENEIDFEFCYITNGGRCVIKVK